MAGRRQREGPGDVDMKQDNACYGCKDRYPGCHSKCEKYAAFLEEKDRNYHKRMEKEGFYVHSSYVRRKKTQYLDNAAKRGFRQPNHAKGSYH